MNWNKVLKFTCMVATAWVFGCAVFHAVAGRAGDAGIDSGIACLNLLLFFDGVITDER